MNSSVNFKKSWAKRRAAKADFRSKPTLVLVACRFALERPRLALPCSTFPLSAKPAKRFWVAFKEARKEFPALPPEACPPEDCAMLKLFPWVKSAFPEIWGKKPLQAALAS